MSLLKAPLARLFLASAVVIAAAADASAHAGGAPAPTVAAGFGHPFAGADHLVAMLAVGFWAGQLGGRGRRVVPAAFLAAMAAGGAVAGVTGASAVTEHAVAASVLIAGVLIAFAARVPTPAAAAVAGLFAFFHGHAHVADLPAGAAPGAYVMGFLAATALLLSAGRAACAVLSAGRRPIVARACGGAVAAIALALYLV